MRFETVEQVVQLARLFEEAEQQVAEMEKTLERLRTRYPAEELAELEAGVRNARQWLEK